MIIPEPSRDMEIPPYVCVGFSTCSFHEETHNVFHWATGQTGQRDKLGNGTNWATGQTGQRDKLGNGTNWATGLVNPKPLLFDHSR